MQIENFSKNTCETTGFIIHYTYIKCSIRKLERQNRSETQCVREPLFVELAVTTAGCSHRVGDLLIILVMKVLSKPCDKTIFSYIPKIYL